MDDEIWSPASRRDGGLLTVPFHRPPGRFPPRACVCVCAGCRRRARLHDWGRPSHPIPSPRVRVTGLGRTDGPTDRRYLLTYCCAVLGLTTFDR